MPQTDAQVGKDPWARFPRNNFTAWIAAEKRAKVAQLRQVEAAKELSDNMHVGLQVLGCVVLLGVAGWCCFSREGFCNLCSWRDSGASGGAYCTIADGAVRSASSTQCAVGKTRGARADSPLSAQV